METVNRILQEKITARIAPNKAVLIFGARRVGKTEKGGVCAVVYPIKGLTKLAKDVPYLTWHVFCSIT